jgi:hypothetical protein
MQRLTWWKCIIAFWCIIDDKKEKEKQKQAALVELTAYVGQCT